MNNSAFFKSRIKAPCEKDCPTRKEYSARGENCHPYCEAYKEYEKAKREEYEKHSEEIKRIWEMNDIEADRITKCTKMRGRKHR